MRSSVTQLILHILGEKSAFPWRLWPVTKPRIAVSKVRVYSPGRWLHAQVYLKFASSEANSLTLLL